MSKVGFKLLAYKTIEKYVDKELTGDIIKQLQLDLSECLNKFITENEIYHTDFPIEYDNEFATWRIKSNGEVVVLFKHTVEHIEVNITLTKDGLMADELDYIDYEGYRYWYEYKGAKDRVDYCLATKDPKKYCNGFYLYSTKDPGSGKCFVVVKHNNPNKNWMKN